MFELFLFVRKASCNTLFLILLSCLSQPVIDRCTGFMLLKMMIVLQVSIVAMQRGEQLMPFKTKSGDTLEILYMEELSAEVSGEIIILSVV